MGESCGWFWTLMWKMRHISDPDQLGSPSHFKCMSHFILFFSSVEGLFLFPDGSNSGLQQPVHEPTWPSWPRFHARQHEPCNHGSRHDTFQYEWATYGHEPAQAAWNESLQPWAKDATASLPWPTSSVVAYAGHEETLSRRGEWLLRLFCSFANCLCIHSIYTLHFSHVGTQSNLQHVKQYTIAEYYAVYVFCT